MNEIILIICVAIISVGIACSFYNNEYINWKTKREVNKWYRDKYGK